MREFWFWVAIVTLIIVCIMLLSFAILHTNVQLKKVDALIMRLEEKEKKREKARRDPIDPE
jgi:cell division protein FtsL